MTNQQLIRCIKSFQDELYVNEWSNDIVNSAGSENIRDLTV